VNKEIFEELSACKTECFYEVMLQNNVTLGDLTVDQLLRLYKSDKIASWFHNAVIYEMKSRIS